MAWDQGAFNDFVQQKYNIQAQEAAARTIEAKGQAGLAGAQAGSIEAKTPAEIAQLQAQTKAIPISTFSDYLRNRAFEHSYSAQAALAPFQAANVAAETADKAQSLISKTDPNYAKLGDQYRTSIPFAGGFSVPAPPTFDQVWNGGLAPVHNTHTGVNVYRGTTPSFDAFGLTDTSTLPNTDPATMSLIHRDLLGGGLGTANPNGTGITPVPKYAKGTAKVPGKGDGTKDTVPAKLAPGEAVLNKPAAEHMGRGLIGVLNAIGEHKMGMMKAA